MKYVFAGIVFFISKHPDADEVAENKKHVTENMTKVHLFITYPLIQSVISKFTLNLSGAG